MTYIRLVVLSLSQSENGQDQQKPAGKFSLLPRRIFCLKLKKAAKPPKQRSLTARFVWKCLPKPPESRDDSNGKSLHVAGFKSSIFDGIAIKNWPTVKSTNHFVLVGQFYWQRECFEAVHKGTVIRISNTATGYSLLQNLQASKVPLAY